MKFFYLPQKEEEDHINNVSKSYLRLHARTYGRDRYARRYWCFRHCGGIYLQGLGSSNEVPPPGVDKSHCGGAEIDDLAEAADETEAGEGGEVHEKLESAEVAKTEMNDAKEHRESDSALAVDDEEPKEQSKKAEQDEGNSADNKDVLNKSSQESNGEPMDTSEETETKVLNGLTPANGDIPMEVDSKEDNSKDVDNLMDVHNYESKECKSVDVSESLVSKSTAEATNGNLTTDSTPSLSINSTSDNSNASTNSTTTTNTATATTDKATTNAPIQINPTTTTTSDASDPSNDEHIHVLDLPCERSCDVALTSAGDACDYLTGELRLPLWMTSDPRTTTTTTAAPPCLGDSPAPADQDVNSNEDSYSGEIDLEMDLDLDVDDEEDISDEAIEANLTEEIRAKVCNLVAKEYTTSKPMPIPRG